MSVALRLYPQSETVVFESSPQRLGESRLKHADSQMDEGFDVLTYCNKKKPVIRKIFLKDGWTMEEVMEAEEQAKRDWPLRSPADFLDEAFSDETVPWRH